MTNERNSDIFTLIALPSGRGRTADAMPPPTPSPLGETSDLDLNRAALALRQAGELRAAIDRLNIELEEIRREHQRREPERTGMAFLPNILLPEGEVRDDYFVAAIQEHLFNDYSGRREGQLALVLGRDADRILMQPPETAEGYGTIEVNVRNVDAFIALVNRTADAAEHEHHRFALFRSGEGCIKDVEEVVAQTFWDGMRNIIGRTR